MKIYAITAATILLSFSAAGSSVVNEKTPGDLKIHDLGTFHPGNEGSSYTTGMSADGRIITGNTSSEIDYDLPHGFYYDTDSSKKIAIDSFRSDKGGMTITSGISADGRVITGSAETDDGSMQAFHFRHAEGKMTRLGTLRTGNTGNSYIRAASADGRVIAGMSQTDSSASGQAFRYKEGDAGITGLGTLRSDNSGSSDARLISADGRVIAGDSNVDGSDIIRAFRHNDGDTKMTALGTLRADGEGNSWAMAISADGRTITGYATTENDDIQAFRHTEGRTGMTSLGTLRQDNSGDSYGRAMSSDGKVIAGAADTDNRSRQAYRLSENDTKMVSLGTLRSDNSGDSDALAISPDGRVVVGKAETDNGDEQAFVHYQGDQKMTGLGTLRSDNTGRSEANRVSADGKVIAGIAQSDTEFRRAVLWVRDKVTEEEVIIDEGKTGDAIAETGKTAFSVLDLYQSALYSLSESRCQIGDSNYCVGAFSQFDNVRSNHRVATGLFGAFRFPAENWIAGASLNFANNTRLTDGYDTRGSNNPGVGAYIRYQKNKDNSGFGTELSGAFLNQDVTITRNHLKNTEAGRGDSSIKAYRFKAAVNYGVNLSETTQLIPNAAISHHNVTRDGYTENSNTNLAATYGRMGNKSTDLRTGIDIRQVLTPDIYLYGGAGIDINLNNQRDAFTSRVNYLGTYAFDNGDSRNVKPYAYAEVNVNVTANSAIGINIGWHQTDYTNDAAQAGLNYSYHW
nr:hypothetical protein SUGSMm_36860 [Morganella morganii subsp. sibonii]